VAAGRVQVADADRVETRHLDVADELVGAQRGGLIGAEEVLVQLLAGRSR
jgi:hypothetical protein